MSEKTSAPLTQFATFVLEGNDTIKFLQGQCTQDMGELVLNMPLLGAFCTAKGRTVTNVQLVQISSEPVKILMVCHASVSDTLFAHLKKYAAFFRQMTFTPLPDSSVVYGLKAADPSRSADVLRSKEAVTAAVQWGDNRVLCWVDSGESFDSLSIENAISVADWNVQDILEQKLWLDADQVESWIPQNVNLDELGGISFKKGCYTGQEVVARLHFKGESKKRLFALKASGELTLADKTISSHGKSVGTIVQAAKNEDGLFVLAVLKVSESQSELYSSENQQVAFHLLH